MFSASVYHIFKCLFYRGIDVFLKKTTKRFESRILMRYFLFVYFWKSCVAQCSGLYRGFLCKRRLNLTLLHHFCNSITMGIFQVNNILSVGNSICLKWLFDLVILSFDGSISLCFITPVWLALMKSRTFACNYFALLFFFPPFYFEDANLLL